MKSQGGERDILKVALMQGVRDEEREKIRREVEDIIDNELKGPRVQDWSWTHLMMFAQLLSKMNKRKTIRNFSEEKSLKVKNST